MRLEGSLVALALVQHFTRALAWQVQSLCLFARALFHSRESFLQGQLCTLGRCPCLGRPGDIPNELRLPRGAGVSLYVACTTGNSGCPALATSQLANGGRKASKGSDTKAAFPVTLV